MKKGLLSFMFVAMAFVGGLANAADTPAPREMLIGVSDAYIPAGFDSRSNAYVVASGVFPNSCYQWSRADVKNVSDTEHEIRSYAKVQPGMCLMVMVPFNKEIQLGKLVSGKHVIRFVNGDDTFLEKELTIE